MTKPKQLRGTNIKPLLMLFSLILVVLSAPSLTRAQEASFHILPQEGNYEIDKTFEVTVFLDSEEVSVNAAQAKISFPLEILRVVNISKENSIFHLWFQEPTWSNSKGEILFGGGLPTPGFKGKSGKVITILFQGKTSGQAKISFEREAILENSPLAPNIFSFSQEGNYLILEPYPEINSSTHPEPDKWYSNNNPEFQWKLKPDTTDISLAFNQKSIFNPGNISQGIFNSKSFKRVEDGVWYFHLKSKKGKGWGETVHFKVQIDTYPPRPFEIIIDNEGDPTNPHPFLYFETKDDTSGINYYEIKIKVGDVFKAFRLEGNPFQMPHQTPGIHRVIVKAQDYAQNFVESEAEVEIKSIAVPKITVCPPVFVSGEEIMYIGGSSLPNSKVLVFFEQNGTLVKKWEISSDETGEWSLKESGLFRSGIYNIVAKTKDSREAISNPSSPCSVKIVLSGIAVGPLIVGYKDLGLISIIVLIVILFGIFRLLWKIRRTKKMIKREAKDLRNKFKKEFDELQVDIKKELEILRRLKEKQEITEEEKKREKELLENLADIERVFEEELKDIEEIK